MATPASTGRGESAGTAPESRLSLLKEREFVTLWMLGALASIIRWLEMLAIGVYVFDVTGSPFLVAVMTVARMAPLALAGMLSGVVAEYVNRRTLLIAGFGLMAVQSAGLALWSTLTPVPIWALIVASFANGLFWTTDFSARRTIMAEVCGVRRIGIAMSLDSITSNGTRMLGPALGGLLLQLIGLDGAFILGIFVYLIGTGLAFSLVRPPDGSGDDQGILASMLEGLRYIRTNRALTATLMITIVFNVWGFPMTSMVPVIGKDFLQLSAFPVGLLMSAEGVGATIAALLITAYSQPRIYKRLYFFGVFLYLDMILLFAYTGWPWLSGAWLLILGLGGAAFASMQAALVLLYTKPEYRSRVMGVLAVCIGTGPLGFIHLGLLADWVGAPLALVIMALEGILALLIVAIIWPEVD
ncbi:MAG: MFS transporter [Pseudomonadota bacterium]